MDRKYPRLIVLLLLFICGFSVWLISTRKTERTFQKSAQPTGENLAPSPARKTTTLVLDEELPPLPAASKNPAPENRPAAHRGASEDPAWAVAEFSDWLVKWKAAPPGLAKRRLENRGIALAQQRRRELYDLMAEDPESFVEAVLSQRDWAGLPKRLHRELATEVEGRGDLEWLAAVPLPGEAPPPRSMFRVATVNGKQYDAYVYGSRKGEMTKTGISIRGLTLDDRMVVLETGARRLRGEEKNAALQSGEAVDLAMEEHIAEFPPEENPVLMYGGQPVRVCCEEHAGLVGNVPENQWPVAAWGGEESSSPDGPVAASSWTEGQKKILAILVDFPDLTGAPTNGSGTLLNAAFINSRINTEVDAYYDETSFGKTGMVTMTSSDVTPVLRMPQNAATYALAGDNTSLRVESLALAQGAGYDEADYDRIFLIFKNLGSANFPGSKITYGGLGQVGNKFMWMNGNFSEGISIHELGHTYGLPHSSRWLPSNSNPIDPAGSLVEYGDLFDRMGSGPAQHPLHPAAFNPRHLNKLDWLPDAAIETVSSGGTFRIHRFDHKNANLALRRAVKIHRDANYVYWIGYRRKYAGHATHSDIAQGAYIFRGAPDGSGKPELLDLDTPGSNFNDASLNVGNTFDDSAGGIEITVDSAGGSGAEEYLDVTIVFDPRIQITSPTLDVDEQIGVANLTLSRTGSGSGGVTVNWSTTDGTATSPADFTNSSGSVSWANGDIADKFISVPLVTDSIVEGSENFTINLTGISGGVLVGETTATVNIVEPGASDSNFSHLWFNNSGSVQRFAVQPDGKIAFVGRTGVFGGENAGGIGRLLSDGSKDDDFFDQGPGADVIAVRSIARQPDGKLIVVGDFTSVRGTSVNRIARLNADGTLDTSFNIGAAGPDAVVKDVVVQPDGKIVIGGNFANVNGTPRQGVARLNADGTLDTSFFTSAPSGTNTIEVETLALQLDGKILIGGFIYANWNAIFSDFSSGIWRLNSDGTIDSSFNIGAGAHAAGSTSSLRRVYAIAVQPDGKVLAGGTFEGFAGGNQPRLVRLHGNNGGIDSSFQSNLGAGPDEDVRSLLVQNDGKILLGGQFKNFAGNAILYAARVHSTGGFDSSFNAGLPEVVPGGSYGNWVRGMAMQPDGKVLLAQDIWGNQQRVISRVFSGLPGLAGTVEFSGGTFSAFEGSTVQVAVRRTGGSTGIVKAAYSTVGGTATEDADYPKTQGVLTWADGDSSDKTIAIPLTEDGSPEPLESFSVQLATPIGGVYIGNQAIAQVNIDGPAPSTISPLTKTINHSAQNYTISVTSGSPWTATETIPWASISPSSGSGNGTITVTVDENTAVTDRNGIITIAGIAHSLTQQGAPPTTTISPLSNTVDHNAQSYNLTVTSNTNWNVTENLAWATVNPSSGSGNGTVTVNVFANSQTSSRNGSIAVGGANHSVTQQGAPPFTNISPASRTIAYDAGPYNITVTSNTAWSVTGIPAWASANPASGAGNGTVAITASQNNTGSARNATIVIGGKSHTLTQQEELPLGSVAGVSASDNLFSDKVLITWSALANAESYFIYRSFSNSYSTSLPIGHTTTTQFSDDTVFEGIPHYYWVAGWRASDGQGSVGVSNQGTRAADTGGDTSAEAGVLGFSGNSATQIGHLQNGDVDWYQFTVSEARTVEIFTIGSVDTEGALFKTDDPVNPINSPAADSDAGIGNNFQISKLLDAGDYYVRVTGKNDNQSGKYTLYVSLGDLAAFRPDIWMGTRRGSMKGNNRYSASASKNEFTLKKRRSAVYYFRAQNDSEATDRLRIRATKTNRNFRFVYYRLTGGKSNITGGVSRGTYKTPSLSSNGHIDIQVKVISRFRSGKKKQVVKPIVYSVSDLSLRDAGKGTLIINR